MNKRLGSILLLASVLALSACGSDSQAATPQNTESTQATSSEPIVVGSVGPDAEIWQFIADSEAAKKAGVTIEVKEITGGPITNTATVDGDVDANAFQSIGYLESFNAESPEKLVPIATTYVEPLGIYSEKFQSIDEITEGATVALADNPSNTTRGLRLLETAGLIKLKADFDDGIGTPDDVIENPKNLQFTLIDDLTGPRILPDVDLVLISNTIALEGGLNVLTDSIFHEEADTALRATVNIIVVKEERAEEEELQVLGELYHDPEVQAFIEEKFDGTKVQVQTPIEEIWGINVKIAIVAAMAEELAPFREVFSSTILWEKGKTKIEAVNPQLFLVESGIGKANAAATSAWLCEKVQPDLIINTGSTGSFRKDFALGDVVYTNQFMYSDVDATGFDYAYGQVPQMPASYPVAAKWLQVIETVLAQATIPAHQGLIVTADSFMSDQTSVAAIRQKFPEIIASDMESAAIAQIAHFYDIPVINLRGISDHVGEEAPDTFTDTLDLAATQAFKAVKALIDYYQIT